MKRPTGIVRVCPRPYGQGSASSAQTFALAKEQRMSIVRQPALEPRPSGRGRTVGTMEAFHRLALSLQDIADRRS